VKPGHDDWGGATRPSDNNLRVIRRSTRRIAIEALGGLMAVAALRSP
jgi:hypothetical protein